MKELLCLSLLILPHFASANSNPSAQVRILAGSTRVTLESRLPDDTWKYEPVSSEDIGTILNAMDDVNKTFSSTLQVPKEINLWVLSEAGFGYGMQKTEYNRGLNKITTGIRQAYIISHDNTVVQTPAKSLNLSIHEYGHVLFSTNLEKVMPEARDLAKLEIREEEYRIALKSLDDTICPISDSLVQSTRHCSEKERLKLEIKKVQIKENPLSDKLSPYSELFADLIAVLETDNKEAITEGFDFLNSNLIDEHKWTIHLRSFSDCSQGFIKSADPESHICFSAPRCALGRYIRPDMSNESKAKVAKIAFKSIVESLRRASKSNRAFNCIEENQKLANDLLQKLTKQNLAPPSKKIVSTAKQ